MLIKIFQIDPKLTFNVFHISNHDHISKIQKNIWWYRTPNKGLLGGSRGLKAKDLGYVSGREMTCKCYINIWIGSFRVISHSTLLPIVKIMKLLMKSFQKRKENQIFYVLKRGQLRGFGMGGVIEKYHHFAEGCRYQKLDLMKEFLNNWDTDY